MEEREETERKTAPARQALSSSPHRQERTLESLKVVEEDFPDPKVV
jgi:hypothetical protein